MVSGHIFIFLQDCVWHSFIKTIIYHFIKIVVKITNLIDVFSLLSHLELFANSSTVEIGPTAQFLLFFL